jgi:hypothetical protein
MLVEKLQITDAEEVELMTAAAGDREAVEFKYMCVPRVCSGERW